MPTTDRVAQPTPGPWTVNREKSAPSIKAGVFEILLTCPTFGEPNERWEANARLIAAAPELLEAVRDFVELYDRLDDAIGVRVLDKVIGARAALAKAEGY